MEECTKKEFSPKRVHADNCDNIAGYCSCYGDEAFEENCRSDSVRAERVFRSGTDAHNVVCHLKTQIAKKN